MPKWTATTSIALTDEWPRSKKKWVLVSQWEKEKTDYEKYLRIKESNEIKEKKKSDRAIKKLKKEGKVQSLAGFLVCRKRDVDEEDDDWMKSKKDKLQQKRQKSLKKEEETEKENKKEKEKEDDEVETMRNANMMPHPDELLFDDDSDDEDEIEELLNFIPFRNAHNKPIIPSLARKRKISSLTTH